MKLNILVAFVLLFNVATTKQKDMIKTTSRYKVKVFKGKWRMYKGEKLCYFKRNKDLSIIEIGGTEKYSYRIKLEEIK